MLQIKNSDSVKANSLFDGIAKNFSLNINQKDFVEKKEGDVIYQSGDPSDHVYLIIEGEIKIKIPGVFKSPVVIKNGKNEFFGEKEFLENGARTTSAVANTDCVLYKFDKSSINNLIRDYPEVKQNLNRSATPDESSPKGIRRLSREIKTDLEMIRELENTPKPLPMDIEEKLTDTVDKFKLKEAEKNLKEVEDLLEESEENLNWDFNKAVDEEAAIQQAEADVEPGTDEDDFFNKDIIPDEEVKADTELLNIDEEFEPPVTEPEPFEPVTFKSDEDHFQIEDEVNEEQAEEKDHPVNSKDELKYFAEYLSGSLNYPISTLKFYIEQLKKRNKSEKLNEVIDLLYEQANIISAVVETTKAYTIKEITLEQEKLSISIVLDDILVQLADYIESLNIKIYKKYETTALVNVDKRKFFLAVFQIAKSILESSPDSEKLFFIVKAFQDGIRIEINSSGSGTDTEINENEFDHFINDRSAAENTGLSIAKTIVENHSGKISLIRQNEGITITILLPASE